MNSFYMRCIRTILGLDLGDRVSHRRVLPLSGQPPLEKIMRRNRLRWFGHVNRMKGEDGEASLTKKMMFSHLPDDKWPSNIGIRKRWEAKIIGDLAKFDIRNWRRETRDRDKWRALINRRVQSHPYSQDQCRQEKNRGSSEGTRIRATKSYGDPIPEHEWLLRVSEVSEVLHPQLVQEEQGQDCREVGKQVIGDIVGEDEDYHLNQMLYLEGASLM